MKGLISFIAVSALAAVMSLASCQDEREPVDTMFSGFMTGYTDSQGYISSLKDDMGNTYKVNNKLEKLQPDTLVRVVAAIALDDQDQARILQVAYPISYVAPKDKILHDSMRVKDPIQIESIYIGGGHLNVNIGIKVQKEGTKHSLIYSQLESPGKLKFTFYHNSYGDKPVYTKHAYVSIPLSGYGLHKNDTVFLSCKGYEEDYDYKLVYK